LESGFSLENLEEKKELVSLLGEYVDLIQSAKPGEPLPVLLFLGGSKNMQTFFSGTDLIEFILAASYLERELTARDINVKVAPAYDLGTGKNGVQEHIDSIIKSKKQVATAYPGAKSKWPDEVKSFTGKHRRDIPWDRTIQAAIISLLIDLEQSHKNHNNQPALHLVFVSHGYKYRAQEKQKNFEDADRTVRLVPIYKTYDHVQETSLITVSAQQSEVDGGPKTLYYYYVDKKLGNVVTGNIGCHSEVGGKTYGYIDQMTRQLVREMEDGGEVQ